MTNWHSRGLTIHLKQPSALVIDTKNYRLGTETGFSACNISTSHDLTYLYLQPSVPCERLSSSTESSILFSVIFENHEGCKIPKSLILPFRMKNKMELAWIFMP